MTEAAMFSYDRILYPNYLHTQTHPDRLATMTKFFGMNAKPVENCRVLELGCGTGSRLLSFAYDLPDSEFVGIDLSEKTNRIGKHRRQRCRFEEYEIDSRRYYANQPRNFRRV